MQREFNLELLANKKAVVNCKTKEEEQEFLTYLDSKNIKWITGSKIFNPTSYKYDRYKEETCFKIDRNNELSFDEIREFKKYTILSLDDIAIETKLNNFEKYGFTADFEGEILNEFDNFYIGYIKTTDIRDNDIFKIGKFLKQNGHFYASTENGEINIKKYNLNQIKTKWYENPDNFPCVVYDCFENKYSMAFFFKNNTINLGYDIRNPEEIRLVTEKEILTLLVKE